MRTHDNFVLEEDYPFVPRVNVVAFLCFFHFPRLKTSKKETDGAREQAEQNGNLLDDSEKKRLEILFNSCSDFT